MQIPYTVVVADWNTMQPHPQLLKSGLQQLVKQLGDNVGDNIGSGYGYTAESFDQEWGWLRFFFPVFLVRETDAAAADTMPLELVVERAAITNKEKCMLLKLGLDLRELVGCV